MTTAPRSRRAVLLDVAVRVTTAIGLSYFVWRILQEDVFGRLPLFLLLIADSLSVILVLASRPTEAVDRSVDPFFLTLLGTFYFVLVRLSHAIGLAMSAGPSLFRFVGVVGTLACILGLSALLAISLARDTHWIPAHF